MDYLLNDFVSEAQKIFECPDFKLQKFEAPLKKYIESPALYEKINEELTHTASDPLYVPYHLRGNNLIIHACKEWMLIYTLYEHVPAHLYTLPMSSLIAPLGRCVLEYDLYDLSQKYTNALFDRELYLLNKRSSTARFGEVVCVDGTTTVMDLRLTSPVGVLKFLIPSKDTLQWTFDRKTGAPLQPISATATGSELAFIAQVLGVLKNETSAPKLKRLAKEHPLHNVRWEAIKSLGKINPELGLDAIRDAVNDEHPHVASAAQRTLARYSTRK